MKYLLVDTMNTFFRAKHIAARQSDTWTKLGFMLHLTLGSVNKVAKRHKVDHVIFCLEGSSWRKAVYEPYKKNRLVLRQAMTESEQEEDAMFFEGYNNLVTYLREKTNCTVLQCPVAEGDDMVAHWIAKHPNDEHVILSSDTDFVQLLAENVVQYNGISDELITLDGIYDDKDRLVIDKKTKEPKPAPNPKWELFEKCMRGDTSDNIFSAYPGVRTKGSSKKVGLQEAFEDRTKQGYNWSNMMLQRWTDHNGVEHRVLDDYNRNVQLVDLTQQPQEVKDEMDKTISEITAHDVGQVGIHFLRFCGKYELIKLSEQADTFSKWLNLTYPGEVHND
jgi:5'-3' exonuclease